MVFGTLGIFYYYLSDETYERASTIAFTTFVMFQMFNAINCRSEKKSIFTIGLFNNKFFVGAIVGCIIMQLLAIYLPIFQILFETQSISFSEIFYSTLLASSVFFMDEIRKYFSSKSEKTHIISSIDDSPFELV